MKIPLFDAHCDTAFQMALIGCGLYENSGHTDLKRGLDYVPYAQFYALFAMDEADIPERFPHLSGLTASEMLKLELELLLKEFEKNSDKLVLCRSSSDAERAALSGKAAAFLSIEGAELIDCDISRLREIHSLGVRAINLTWNNPNALANSRGLTELGAQFVRECNSLGIIIDVSHLSDAAFQDVIELTEKPVIASHSNSRAIFYHGRNLTNDQFAAIKENGGVAGINLFADFIGEKPTVSTVIEHIEHFLFLGGDKNIAIGADLDGCERLPEGINGIEDIGKIFSALLKRNYPEALLYDIFYNNLMRVVGEVCVT